MTDFVKQHTTVVGDPRYPVKTVQGIDYMTGTRINRVHSITEQIPRLINLFGRQINCIYTAQPEYQEQLKEKRQEREQRYNDLVNDNSDATSNTNFYSDHSENNLDTQPQDDTDTNNQSDIENIKDTNNIINQINNQPENIQTENEPSRNTEQTKPLEQQNKTKRQVNQQIPKNTNNITKHKPNNKNNNHPEIRIDNPPPEFTTQNYPPLQENLQKTQGTQQTQEQSQNKTIIEETLINEQPQPEPTIIEERPILQQITNTDTSSEFLSQPMISIKMTTLTPETVIRRHWK